MSRVGAPPVLRSLRVKLPLLTSAVIVAVLATFVVAAYREITSTLLRSAGERAQGAVTQLAVLLTQSAHQRVAEVERAAAAPAVRDFVEQPTRERQTAAEHALAPLLATAEKSSVDLWDANGRLLLSLPSTRTTGEAAPQATGILPLRASANLPFTDFAAGVRTTASGARPAAILRVRHAINAGATSELLSKMVGNQAVLLLGNRDGSVWTDLSKVVEAPSTDLTRGGVSSYVDRAGNRRLAAMQPIPGTPWSAAVAFPRAGLLAPARAWTRRMIAYGLGVAAAAGLLVLFLSARITTPLRELTDASEALAAGRDGPLGPGSGRSDEIGRLSTAFNAMAAQIREAHRELEARVQQRTARLEEAHAHLEAQIREARAARDELDRFFEVSLDLLSVGDTSGRLTRVNSAWTETLGWTPDEVTGRPYSEFVHPEDRDATAIETTRLASGTSTVNFKNRYRAKDGSHRWLQWKSVPIPDRGVVYGSARDITDQMEAAAVLEQRAAELSALNHELEAFSYSVSHDLRAPLRHISGFATLLEKSAGPALDDQGRRYLSIMLEASARMGRLIDDLLAFSRMGRTAMAKHRVGMDDLVDGVRREVGAASPGREIAWTVHPLPEVEADPAMLRQVFVNLLSNAVKYTRPRPRAEIEIGVHPRREDETVIFVRDNGVGFDPQYTHKLFGVFQRLHRSEEFDGTGIGLANVRRIVHRHGGEVWAEGMPDRGATFYVSIPAGAGRGNHDGSPNDSDRRG